MSASILDVLTEDALNIIVDEFQWVSGFKDLTKMRLVCKAMSNLIEPRAFSKTTISFNQPWSENQLKSFALGNGPNSRWTKSLNIEHLYYTPETTSTSWERVRVDPAKQEEQRALLISAISALKSVESARLRLEPERPNNEALLAVSQLPRLQSVDVFFDMRFTLGDDNQLTPTLSHFVNLRSLHVRNAPPGKAVTDVCKVITNSPALETLFLHFLPPIRFPDPLRELRAQLGMPRAEGDSDPTPEAVSELVKDSLSSPTFVPTLKTMLVPGSHLHFSHSATPYFRVLTKLHVDREEMTANIDVSFWTGLSQQGAKLKFLYIYPLTAASFAYLDSYAGLEELYLFRGDLRVEDTVVSVAERHSMADLVFHRVLPRHKDTLQILGTKGLSNEAWALKNEYLDQVLQCKELRRLCLVFRYTAHWYAGVTSDINVPHSIMRIAEALPFFKKFDVHLDVTGGGWGLNLQGNPALVGYLDNQASSFGTDVCSVEFPLSLHPAFEMVVYGGRGGWKLVFDSSSRRFMKCALQLGDIDMI
ncbi:hypothetical protein DFP72DRAFT_900869 [Ephemerocybe angulata]|uniref:Uncharacterized protein n=1 Tax=Ephemerocybe angulata TaxID=980116 RepID=A0A8H6HY39_9AGAR|nr:hypothetical protein DFP72DRAFT_900869 [Tulosesus angulatus]